MPKKEKERDKIIISEQIFEVRHDPIGEFLDIKGKLAEHFRKELKLFSDWRIEENNIQFINDQGENRIAGFASFNRAGYSIADLNTKNYFADKASIFWDKLFKNPFYPIKEIKIKRFGSRTKLFYPSTRNFEDIRNTIINKQYRDNFINMLGNGINDVAFIIEFNQSEFHVKLRGGPMKENEIVDKGLLNIESDHFKKCGIYLDLDYTIKNDIDPKNIKTLLRTSIDATWLKVDQILNFFEM